MGHVTSSDRSGVADLADPKLRTAHSCIVVPQMSWYVAVKNAVGASSEREAATAGIACVAGRSAGAACRLSSLFAPLAKVCGLLVPEGATSRVSDDACVGDSAEAQQQALPWGQLAARSSAVDADVLMVAWWRALGR